MRGKRRPYYLWIDDNPYRRRMAQEIEDVTGIKVVFRNVKNKDLAQEIADLLKKRKPGLVLIDHFLDVSRTDGFGISHGSTIAETFREHWQGCPIIGITAAKKRPNVDHHKESIYDLLYSYTNFSGSIEYLPIIAEGFHSLSRSKIKNVDNIIRRLKAPKEEWNRIESVLPDDLKREFNDLTLPSRLFKWVRNPLIMRPGFLYDQLWVATLLGLRETGFEKVKELFSPALYYGIFASPTEPRWWASEIRRIVYSKCLDSEGRLPWEVGRNLPGIIESDFSKCYSSNEPYPEIVAFVDEESDERHPMCLRYTVPHPKYEKLLFFEEIRMMAERDKG